MAKKEKFKYKHLTEEKFNEYQDLSKDDLIDKLKTQSAYLDTALKKKKNSAVLKELRSEINDFRKGWAKEHPEKVEEIEGLKEAIKEIEAERDAKILSDIDEKKDMEGGFNDTIAGAREHIDALVHCLRFHP